MSLWDRFSSWGTREPADALVNAAKKGDRRAYDALVRPYRPVLLGFIARRVGSEPAEDVMQETLLAGWSSLRSFQGRSRFKAWLFRIAIHKCMDHHRGSSSDMVEPYTEEMVNAALVVSPGVDPYAASELKHVVRSAMAGLPDSQRELLELYYYAELTLPEIATAIDRNLNTVKYQFYRAHAQMADSLADVGEASSARTSEAARPSQRSSAKREDRR